MKLLQCVFKCDLRSKICFISYSKIDILRLFVFAFETAFLFKLAVPM